MTSFDELLPPPEGYHYELDSDIFRDTVWVLVKDAPPPPGKPDWPAYRWLLLGLMALAIFIAVAS